MSNSFAEYLNHLNRKYSVEIDQRWIAGAIIGRPEDPTNTYLSQIVNGPFDADKLDYIFRDGTFMGVPQIVDLDRLWYGVKVETRDISKNEWERILVLDHGAASPLEQIVFFKLVLFQTLYHHQKVRAVDCMLKAIVEFVREHPKIKISIGDAKDIGLEHATDYLWLTDDTFFSLAYQVKDRELHRLIHNIRYRRLFKRALVIRKQTIEEHSLDRFHDIRRLAMRNDADRLKETRAIAREIWERAKRPCSRHEVWFDIPYPPSGKEGDFAYVRYPKRDKKDDYELVKLSQSFPAKMWADMYWQYKWQAHVFCPRDAVEKISLAAKEVIESRFDIKLNDLSQKLCHVE